MSEDIDKLLEEALGRVHAGTRDTPRDSPASGDRWYPTIDEIEETSPQNPKVRKRLLGQFPRDQYHHVGNIWPFPLGETGKKVQALVEKLPFVATTSVEPLFPDHPEYPWGVITIALEGHPQLDNYGDIGHQAMHELERGVSDFTKHLIAGHQMTEEIKALEAGTFKGSREEYVRKSIEDYTKKYNRLEFPPQEFDELEIDGMSIDSTGMDQAELARQLQKKITDLLKRMKGGLPPNEDDLPF